MNRNLWKTTTLVNTALKIFSKSSFTTCKLRFLENFCLVFTALVTFFRGSLKLFKRLAQAARLMVGVGDYETYVAHCKQHHPQHNIMTKEEYFLNRLHARYPGKKGNINRCPC